MIRRLTSDPNPSARVSAYKKLSSESDCTLLRRPILMYQYPYSSFYKDDLPYSTPSNRARLELASPRAIVK